MSQREDTLTASQSMHWMSHGRRQHASPCVTQLYHPRRSAEPKSAHHKDARASTFIGTPVTIATKQNRDVHREMAGVESMVRTQEEFYLAIKRKNNKP